MTEDHQPSVCEEEVFYRIHEEQSGLLRSFLYYKFGSIERARDCTQEAFARLWINCIKVTYTKARSYLFTTANRLFVDEMRKEKVNLKFVKQANIDRFERQHPEFQFQEQEFKELLEQAISNLPEKQRTVFLLSRIDKLANKEIAEALDISVKGVERHITGALKRLREELLIHKSIKI